jgi:hypothetical protein
MQKSKNGSSLYAWLPDNKSIDASLHKFYRSVGYSASFCDFLKRHYLRFLAHEIPSPFYTDPVIRCNRWRRCRPRDVELKLVLTNSSVHLIVLIELDNFIIDFSTKPIAGYTSDNTVIHKVRKTFKIRQKYYLEILKMFLTPESRTAMTHFDFDSMSEHIWEYYGHTFRVIQKLQQQQINFVDMNNKERLKTSLHVASLHFEKYKMADIYTKYSDIYECIIENTGNTTMFQCSQLEKRSTTFFQLFQLRKKNLEKELLSLENTIIVCWKDRNERRSNIGLKIVADEGQENVAVLDINNIASGKYQVHNFCSFTIAEQYREKFLQIIISSNDAPSCSVFICHGNYIQIYEISLTNGETLILTGNFPHMIPQSDMCKEASETCIQQMQIGHDDLCYAVGFYE